MIKIADNPVVLAQLARSTGAADETPAPISEAVEYARAPAATGPAATGSRPPAVQGAAR